MHYFVPTLQINGGYGGKAISPGKFERLEDVVLREDANGDAVRLKAFRVDATVVIVRRRNKESAVSYDTSHLAEIGVQIHAVLDYAQTSNRFKKRAGKLR